MLFIQLATYITTFLVRQKKMSVSKNRDSLLVYGSL